jgi:predicted phosphodiesterase
MKIAVLADIHGNLPALAAVLADIEHWQPDRVVVAGDVVNRGPRPQECLELVLQLAAQQGWLVLQGNHEEYVINCANPNRQETPAEVEISRNAQWTYRQLGQSVRPLQAIPAQIDLKGPDGRPLRFVHASMISNRDGIYPDHQPSDLRRLIAPAPAVLCAGHTHRPVIHWVDGSLVVNVGSVGMPFDGDQRASYAQLTWRKKQWRPEIIRVGYDWQQTEQDFFQSGFLPHAGDLARIMLHEFRRARPLLNIWANDYYDAVLSGKISVAESVARFMARKGLSDPQPPPPLQGHPQEPPLGHPLAVTRVGWSPAASAVAVD